MYSVLFVCTGNICRSPTAHGIFEKYVQEAGLQNQIHVDSAAISSFHVGQQPDERAIQTALAHDVPLYHLRARQVTLEDFNNFDLIIAMDSTHYRRLNALCPKNTDKSPRIARMTDWALQYGTPDIPDPYYGGTNGFEIVFEMIEAACQNLLTDIRSQMEEKNG